MRSFPAVPESVPCARRAIELLAAAAGADPEQLEAIRLSVSEAVSNVVLHAYPRNEPGLVHVTAAAGGNELTVLIADDGCGFRRPSARAGLGWGMALIGEAADRFTIMERSGGGTEARIGFRLGAWPQEDGSCDAASAPAASRFSTTR